VEAPDQGAAIKAAIKKFEIMDPGAIEAAGRGVGGVRRGRRERVGEALRGLPAASPAA
jgi:hypothetical protein